MDKTKSKPSLSWGIPVFDLITQGLPKGDLSVIETPDYHSGQIALGHFLFEGLKKGERCVLITFDTPELFLQNFLVWNLDFEKYIKSGHFIILKYKANFSNEIGLTHNYSNIFEEIFRLSGQDQKPSRIAIQQVDSLINLNNLILMNQSAQKLANAIHTMEGGKPTVLGQYVQFGDQIHRDLAICFQKTVSGYLSLERPVESEPYKFLFVAKKMPWFDYVHYPCEMDLVEGQGFVGAEVLFNGRVA